MTPKQEAALRQALETFERMGHKDSIFAGEFNGEITAIREALAEQPAQQQEPVAWVREHELPLAPGDAFSWVETFVHKTPLYTSPPASKPWVGLTEEEVDECYYWKGRQWTTDELVRHVEAKLREKNNG